MPKANTNSSALKFQIVNKALNVQATDVELMLEHNRTGAELPPHTLLRLERIRKIWTMLCEGKAKNYVVKTVGIDAGLTERQIYNDINLSYEIYGNLETTELSGKLVASINFYEKIAQKAYQDDDLKSAIDATKEANKLTLELHKRTSINKKDPVTKWSFRPVNAPEVIDTDYELDE